MHAKNYELHILGSVYDAVRFGEGKEHLVVIPGLGDGICTVKGKALMGAALYRRYLKNYTVTVISRKRVLEENATTCSMAKDQALAMEALGIRKAHVMGVSQGGMIAQHLAADYPRMVEKLILVATAPKADEKIRRNVSRWVDFARTGAWTSLVVDMSEKAYPEKKRKLLRPVYPFLTRSMEKMDVERFVTMAQACAQHDAEDKLDRIQCPTLILGGGQDRTLGVEGSHRLHRFIGGSELRIYEDQGHSLHEDAPDFHDTVLSFLRKTPEDSQFSPV